MTQEDQSFSRKGFLHQFGGLFKKGLVNHVDRKIAKTLKGPLRPPGALDEVEFLSTCTRCSKCVTACPYGVILRQPLDSGLGANTPFINPDGQACRLCVDFPCISACEDRALLPVASPRQVSMGKALIQTDTCNTYKGKVCTLCYDACPFPEQALTLDADFHPKILDACTGCGACQQRCPTHPVGVKVMSHVSYRAHQLEEETYFGFLSKEKKE